MTTLLTRHIAEQIKTQIQDGLHLRVRRNSGTLWLQPERQLCVKLKVSRPTLRKAIVSLEDQGLVKRVPGRGIEIVKTGVPRSGSATKLKMMWIRPVLNNSWIKVTEGIRKLAREAGVELHVIDVRGSIERGTEAIVSPPAGVKGLLVAPLSSAYQDAVNKAARSGLKIVLVSHVLPSMSVSSVTTDNFHSGYKATCHLIETHGRPVYHVSHKTPSSSSCQDRTKGWSEAMEEHGFSQWQRYFIELPRGAVEAAMAPDTIQDDACRVMKDIFGGKKQDKYSILAVGDKAAMGIYQAARQSSLAVGKDVFMVGSYNLPLCQRMDPPLSSVEHYPENVGYEAASLLHDELTGRSSTPVHRVLPVSLKIRASSTGEVAAPDEVAARTA